MIKKNLAILSLAILFSFKSKNACTLLPDGNYLVKITFNRYEKDYKMSLYNGIFTKVTPEGDTTTGGIVWLAGCYFKIDYPTKPQHDTTTAFENTVIRSFGEPCIELRSANEDTIYFRTTHTGNLEVTSELGKFIRIK